MNINEGLLRNVNAASGGGKWGGGQGERTDRSEGSMIEGILKIMSDLSLPYHGNVSGCFIFIKTRVKENFNSRIKLAFSKQRWRQQEHILPENGHLGRDSAGLGEPWLMDD